MTSTEARATRISELCSGNMLATIVYIEVG